MGIGQVSIVVPLPCKMQAHQKLLRKGTACMLHKTAAEKRGVQKVTSRSWEHLSSVRGSTTDQILKLCSKLRSDRHIKSQLEF